MKTKLVIIREQTGGRKANVVSKRGSDCNLPTITYGVEEDSSSAPLHNTSLLSKLVERLLYFDFFADYVCL